MKMKVNLVPFNFFLIFSYISCGISVEFDNFYVEKSGHSKVKPGEISVVFYMTVANSGMISKKIYSKNTKCCWVHPGSGSKYDCESMDLLGGMPVTLEPSKTANITYLFTNLYPLDRVGQCVFHLWQSKNKIAHTIRFNTTYHSEEVRSSWLGSLYKTIAGDDKKNKVCDTVDLDPRRSCKPVKCVQKYNGKRNFFRKETKLCEPVHECYTSKDDEGLPTTAFDKDHNKCKSLIHKELTKDEEQDLKKNVESHMEAAEKAMFKTVGVSDPIPVRCNHGKHVGEMCVCDDGWKTDTSNVPLGDPKFVYNWCNVRTRKKPFLPYKQQKRFMIAGLSLTSLTLFVSWLWMIHRYMCPQPDEKEQAKKHVWQKNKRDLLQDSTLISAKGITGSSSIIENKGSISFIKQPSESLAQQPTMADEHDMCICNVSISEKTGELLPTTQENSSPGSDILVSRSTMAMQNVSPSASAIIQQQSHSLPVQTTLENGGSFEKQSSRSQGKAKTSRIVSSRTTRAGSTYTLAGPIFLEKCLSKPVVENFSDSD